MPRKTRRSYEEFGSIIPWASMGRPSVASQVGQSLLPIGVYDPNLSIWQYEGSQRVLTNTDKDFEKYLINIVGTAIHTGTGKLVTCLHVVNEIIQQKSQGYALVTRTLSENTVVHTSCRFGTVLKYVRPGEIQGDNKVDLALIPFVPRDNLGNFIETPSIVWGDSTTLGVGHRVLIGGYPYGTDLFKLTKTNRGIIQPTFFDGIISAIIPAQNQAETRLLQLSTLTAGGMSGGVVFDPETGEAYGMITSSLQDAHGALHPVTYAIPSEVILPYSGSFNYEVEKIGRIGHHDPMWFDDMK